MDWDLRECTDIASGNIEDVSKEPHTVCFFITASRRAPIVSCVFPDDTNDWLGAEVAYMGF